MNEKNQRKPCLRAGDNLWGYAFVMIPVIGAFVFVIFPFLMSIYASFTAWPLGRPINSAKLVGIRNYTDMLSTGLFWKSLGNTFYYMLGIPVGLVISLYFAYLMNRSSKSERAFRVIYYIPVVTSTVAISFIFQRMFMTDGGVINSFLMDIGFSDLPNWMSDPRYTKLVIIIMTVWKGLGSSIILYIAGMQGISPAYYEAARIDGANWFQRFRKITFPLLRPVTFYLVVTGVIGGAQMYVEPRLIFTENGPANSTFTTVMHLYDYTFRNSKAGYGSAVAVVLGIVIFIVTALQFYISGRRDRLEKKKAYQ